MNKYILISTFFFSSFTFSNTIEEKVSAVLPPESKIESIEESVIDGLYKVYFGDLQPLYVSKNGNYFIYGDLYQIEQGSVINLSTLDLDKRRKNLLDTIPAEDLIQFKSNNEKHNIFVFTDVDCGYCRKLHAEIADYSELGIEVRYLAYPRTGLDGETHKKMSNVWCSADRKRALTKAKLGLEVDADTCADPVVEQFQLGRMIGVSGTPAIVTSDGRLLPGYVPAPDLLARLQQ